MGKHTEFKGGSKCSPISETLVELSFDMFKVHTHLMVIELYVRKEEERKENKIEIFMFVFLRFCMG